METLLFKTYIAIACRCTMGEIKTSKLKYTITPCGNTKLYSDENKLDCLEYTLNINGATVLLCVEKIKSNSIVLPDFIVVTVKTKETTWIYHITQSDTGLCADNKIDTDEQLVCFSITPDKLLVITKQNQHPIEATCVIINGNLICGGVVEANVLILDDRNFFLNDYTTCKIGNIIPALIIASDTIGSFNSKLLYENVVVLATTNANLIAFQLNSQNYVLLLESYQDKFQITIVSAPNKVIDIYECYIDDKNGDIEVVHWESFSDTDNRKYVEDFVVYLTKNGYQINKGNITKELSFVIGNDSVMLIKN